MVLLSVKAGLRAGESGKLTWEMLIDPEETLGSSIELRDHTARPNDKLSLLFAAKHLACQAPAHETHLEFGWR
jgi:hypothetical protein